MIKACRIWGFAAFLCLISLHTEYLLVLDRCSQTTRYLKSSPWKLWWIFSTVFWWFIDSTINWENNQQINCHENIKSIDPRLWHVDKKWTLEQSQTDLPVLSQQKSLKYDTSPHLLNSACMAWVSPCIHGPPASHQRKNALTSNMLSSIESKLYKWFRLTRPFFSAH